MKRYYIPDNFDMGIVWRVEDGKVTVASLGDKSFYPSFHTVEAVESRTRITEAAAFKFLGLPHRSVKSKLYVATIVRKDADRAPVMESQRSDDAWITFVGEDRDALIEKASNAIQGYTGRTHAYEVLIGELTQAVRPVKEFKLENL